MLRLLTGLRPRIGGIKKEDSTGISFRWFHKGFDLFYFEDKSIFIQFGDRPVKYLCVIRHGSKSFPFLGRRLSWKQKASREFKKFNLVYGHTTRPLPVCMVKPVEKVKEQQCHYSQLSQKSSNPKQTHLLTE